MVRSSETYKTMLLQLLLILGVALITVSCNCGPCIAIPRHYEELGCVGKYIDGPCCENERFECPDLNVLDTSMCHFKGETYKIGESVSKTNSPLCTQDCICNEGRHGFAEFNCPVNECENIIRQQKSDCVVQYSLDNCCAVTPICGDEATNLPKCHFRGKTYIHGEKFIPESNYLACHNCICDENFDNSTNIEHNKNCKKIECGMELRYFDQFKRGCVPIYVEDTLCCPIGFKCPDENDKVLSQEGYPDISSVNQNTLCRFGNLTLQRSQIVETADKCVECFCNKPPMIECIRQEGCD